MHRGNKDEKQGGKTMKTNKNFMRKFLAIVLAIVTLVSPSTLLTTFAAEVDSNTYSGFCMIADKNYTVYSSPQFTSSIGTIFKDEGATVLAARRTSGYFWIEYNTPSGPKRGYIRVPIDDDASISQAVAQVAVSSTVYYGRTDRTGAYGSYQSAGTVYSGEFVVILAKNDDWAYIEYNASNGYRKRGHVKYSNLTVYNRAGLYADLYSCYTGRSEYVTGREYVYSGFTTAYPQVGYVENEYVRVLYSEDYGQTCWMFIEYSAGGQTKSGYIIIDY